MILDKALSKIFGTKHERDVKALMPRVQAIGALEDETRALTDDELRARFAELKARVQKELEALDPKIEIRREQTRKALDPVLVPCFALVREAARRAIGQRHYDVQLMGGIVLHEGKIAEMRTGEGKTLVGTLAVSLNALTGRGVHVVTVNDYLARRDSDWMGRVYRFLGLTVGCIQHDMDDTARRAAYACDITYGTNNEFGFDYLRDNMKFDLSVMVQRGHVFATVDEVDSILIDEARTPLIISGPSEGDIDIYFKVDRIIPKLVRGEEIKDKYGNKTTTGDYLVDEKSHTAALTDEGVSKCERLLGIENLYDPVNIDDLHACQQALRAHTLYKADVNYVVRDGQVLIVDEFTGRLMPGRRWSDGLHQAVEAKEGVKIEKENQTLATITLQNYFRMYDKLAGMTGTADTEASEFGKIYNLDVVVIPTNRPMIRKDDHDLVFRTEREKFEAVAEEIVEKHEKGQPVLVGTISIEKSENLSNLLKKKAVPHVVLNAKYHEQEANIVAQAGQVGRVTIATNMAGRGTDILLGGNAEYLARQKAKDKTPEEFDAIFAELTAECQAAQQEVKEAGGLHIIGTERHESRRIDNQLRGRAGRQGDPGSSRFYLSLEDDLMRIFGSDRLSGLMKRLGMEEGVPIEHRWVTRSIERAQTQVEGRNFDTRKHLLEYDDVMNKQRESVYRLRKEILSGEIHHAAAAGDEDTPALSLRQYAINLAEDVAEDYVDRHCPATKDPSEWNWTSLESVVQETFGLKLDELGIVRELSHDGLKEKLRVAVADFYRLKAERIGPETLKEYERFFMLQTVDTFWKDHLLGLDHLKEGIGLRGYGQRDPLVEYKKESFTLFEAMKEGIEEQMLQYLFRFEIVPAEVVTPMSPRIVDEEPELVGVGVTSTAPPSAGGATATNTASASREGGAALLARKAAQRERELSYQGAFDPTAGADFAKEAPRPAGPKVGRNDPCPCGSGKKYKKCHGAAGGD
ncbi:MAG: preprotein translocase subunit SecA [Acidobacteria bacterium]|nr:preprotein translocase subunit SecA [Acidobacteriota bacterium]